MDKTKLIVIEGNRVALERELLESIFRGERNDAVVERLKPRLTADALTVLINESPPEPEPER